MEVFNSHKQQLAAAIRERIDMADAHCRELNKQIYLYSDERLTELLRKQQENKNELDELKKIRNNKERAKVDLQGTISLLQQQHAALVEQLAEQQRNCQMMARQLIFADQRNKEQVPHFEEFLSERQKSNQSNKNIKYAQEKLKKLESSCRKQAEEVQYKQRLVKVMKEKLKEIKTKRKQNCLTNQNQQKIGESTVQSEEFSLQEGFTHESKRTDQSCEQE